MSISNSIPCLFEDIGDKGFKLYALQKKCECGIITSHLPVLLKILLVFNGKLFLKYLVVPVILRAFVPPRPSCSPGTYLLDAIYP